MSEMTRHLEFVCKETFKPKHYQTADLIIFIVRCKVQVGDNFSASVRLDVCTKVSYKPLDQ